VSMKVDAHENNVTSFPVVGSKTMPIASSFTGELDRAATAQSV